MEKSWLRIVGLWALAMLLLWAGCAESPVAPPNHLLGHWKVIHVNRGGTILGGPRFNGTEYTFRENGTVFGQGPNGDTLTSRYRQGRDSLTYVAIGTGAEEHYHMDSLTADKLVISAEIDGIPTSIRMMKLKK